MARAIIEVILQDDDSEEMNLINVMDSFSAMFIGEPSKSAHAADVFRGMILKVSATRLTS